MTFSKRALARKAEGMNLSEFLNLALRIKKPAKPRVYVVDEGEKAIHRDRQDRNVAVSVKRSYRINRNAYNPQTCSRPKEAAKAAKRAAKMQAQEPVREAAE